MSGIRQSSPEVHNKHVSIGIRPSYRLRSYINKDVFEITFDSSVEDCPPGILLVPAVMTLAPVAWANGTSVSVPEVGVTFADSIERVQRGYADLYPDVFDPTVPAIRSDKTLEYELPQNSAPSILFSGGVDSIAAYVSNKKTTLVGITIHGSDVDNDQTEAWETVRRQINRFVTEHEMQISVIRSNFRSILNYRMLNIAFAERLGRDWWGAVHYGVGLPALCAPIAYQRGLNSVYQGSGYTTDSTYPTSQPIYVDKLKWAGTENQIVDVDTTRQEKLERIAGALESGQLDSAATTIRSCYRSESGTNCSSCSKCYRTILGLLVAGVDPVTLGFDVSSETLTTIRSELKCGNISLSELNLEFWRSIQSSVDPDREYEYDDCGFFDWFLRVDLAALADGSNSQPSALRSIERISDQLIRSVPYPADITIERLRHRTARALRVET